MKRVFPIFMASLFSSIPGGQRSDRQGPLSQLASQPLRPCLSRHWAQSRFYVTAWDLRANTAGDFSLVYGSTTKTPCDTGTVALTGTYDFAAQSGLSRDGGVQPLFVIPPGNAICAVTSGAPAGASVSMAGSLSYTQY